MAQTAPARAESAGQATVARLNYLEGAAQVASATGNVEPVDAAVNMPLWPGQTIQTSAQGAAEIEFTDGSLLRVTGNSSATLVRLETEAQIGLGDGLFYLELRAADNPQFSVFAGQVSVIPAQNASFRIRMVNGQAEIAVLSGAVSVTRPNAYTVDLQAGESLRSDPKNNNRYLLAEGVPQETWDSWNERRAQALQDDAANTTIARDNYASAQGYGWSDLDAYGTWYAMPGEGMVWQPDATDASFDPYGYGSWVYGPAGYTWASGYAWGWTPYHCGEWRFLAGFGWFWIPSAGCRSYGGGWYGAGWGEGGGGGRGPRGWRPPHPPPPPHQIASGSGIHIKPPTIPIHPIDGPPLARVSAVGGPHHGRPVQIGDVTLHTLAPVGQPRTPQGGSAVGSALRRDFPVQNGTHQPLLGQQGSGSVAVPGRADWHSGMHGRPAEGAATLQATPGTTNNGNAPAQVVVGSGWRSSEGTQVAPPQRAVPPAEAGVPGAGRVTGGVVIAPARTPQTAPVRTFGGAGATPYTPQPAAPAAPREPAQPIMRPVQPPAAIRTAPIAPAPAAPRMAAPAPAPAPSPAVHMSPAPAPAPAPAAASPARTSPK